MKNKDLTTLAMIIAITIVLGIVPNIGIIQIGAISLTILHIPVIVASFILGIKGGIITGLAFGLSSLYVAATRAYTPIDLLFVNPLISVLPRVLFGLASGVICSRLKDSKPYLVGLSGFVCTIIHSVLVYIALFLWGSKQLNVEFTALGFFKYIIAAISINSLIEAIVAGLICAALLSSISRIKKRLK